MGKKSKPHLHNVAMFVFGSTILLVNMRIGDLMRDANIAEKGVELLMFPTSIGLDDNDLAIKPSFNQT
jgi:hypothetical protein